MREEGFFKFIQERHNIWHERFILKNKPPWTDDSILGTTKYTNVYRELDRNTVWFIINVANNSKMDYPAKVLNTLVFSILNNITTVNLAGGMPLDIEEYPQFLEDLIRVERDNRKLGTTVMTNAYFVYPVVHGMPKLQGYVTTVFYEFLKTLEDTLTVLDEGDPLKLVNHLLNYKGVGNFVAYEIYCNLVHLGITGFTFDSYVNVGPGAVEGLKRIYGNTLIGDSSRKEALYNLTLKFPKFIESSGLPFWYLSPDKSVHLRFIEHSLCEYHKYCTQSERDKNYGRAKYFPKEHHEDYLTDYYDSLTLFSHATL